MFRKFSYRLIVVGLLLLLTFSSFAQEAKRGSKRQLESSYFMYSLGIAADIGDGGMVSQGLTDDFHFYLPLSSKLLLGVGYYGTGIDSMDASTDLHFLLVSISSQYYFNSIGDGLFLRGDFGRALGFHFNDDGLPESIDAYGYGFRLDIGYAIAISQEGSILLSMSYRENHIEGNYFGDIGFHIGLLW